MTRPHRLAWPRTPPFQGGDTGSNPVGDAKSSAARGASSRAIGNIIHNDGVPRAMDAFEAAPDEHLAERLVRGLEAGLNESPDALRVRKDAHVTVSRPQS